MSAIVPIDFRLRLILYVFAVNDMYSKYPDFLGDREPGRLRISNWPVQARIEAYG